MEFRKEKEEIILKKEKGYSYDEYKIKRSRDILIVLPP